MSEPSKDDKQQKGNQKLLEAAKGKKQSDLLIDLERGKKGPAERRDRPKDR